ncbi:hypothetical protein ACTA71_000520 [Dictyostelium dimigraforme]
MTFGFGEEQIYCPLIFQPTKEDQISLSSFPSILGQSQLFSHQPFSVDLSQSRSFSVILSHSRPFSVNLSYSQFVTLFLSVSWQLLKYINQKVNFKKVFQKLLIIEKMKEKEVLEQTDKLETTTLSKSESPNHSIQIIGSNKTQIIAAKSLVDLDSKISIGNTTSPQS